MMVRRKPPWNRLASGLYVPPLLGFAGNPWPCPGCCAGCEYFSDDFDRSDDTDLGANWTEVAGAWEIASNVLSTSSNDAICICNTDGIVPYVVRAVIGGGSSKEFRVIFNYVDSSNYFYASATVGSNVKIFTVIGGTHTRVFNGPSLGSDTCIQVCVHATFVTVMTGDGSCSTLTPKAAVGISSTSGTCGVGTGSNSGTFDDFSIQKHHFTLAGCPECVGTCTLCVDDLVSEHYQVVITGVVGPEDCSSANGTWILGGLGCTVRTGDLDFEVAAACSSKSRIVLHFERFALGGCDAPANYYQVSVFISVGPTATCLSNCRVDFVASKTTKYDCDDLVDLSLSPGGAPQYCDPSSGTCKVTSL